jgi:hypothetical protein
VRCAKGPDIAKHTLPAKQQVVDRNDRLATTACAIRANTRARASTHQHTFAWPRTLVSTHAAVVEPFLDTAHGIDGSRIGRTTRHVAIEQGVKVVATRYGTIDVIGKANQQYQNVQIRAHARSIQATTTTKHLVILLRFHCRCGGQQSLSFRRNVGLIVVLPLTFLVRQVLALVPCQVQGTIPQFGPIVALSIVVNRYVPMIVQWGHGVANRPNHSRCPREHP